MEEGQGLEWGRGRTDAEIRERQENQGLLDLIGHIYFTQKALSRLASEPGKSIGTIHLNVLGDAPKAYAEALGLNAT